MFVASTYLTSSSIPPSNLWQFYWNPVNIEDDVTGGDLRYWFQYLVGGGGTYGWYPFILKKDWFDTTWVIQNWFVSPPYRPYDICNYNDELLFVCGSDGKIFHSTDAGDSWTEQYSGVTNILNAISLRYDSIGYSVGDTGTIVYTSNGGVSSVNEENLPIDFSLYQNYPNPFNPVTKIRFRNAHFGFVNLKVYDILGNEVATLVNKELPAGEYEVEFSAKSGSASGGNASNLSSGIYFYTLRAGEFIQTKKMILIK
jgi:hypothetical protein